MPRVPDRPVPYTRTSIIHRYLDRIAESLPDRVDARFAAEQLGLRGGDIRAFLQSARVFGFIDASGALSDLSHRTRSPRQRRAAMQEAIANAFPDLLPLLRGRQRPTREVIEGEIRQAHQLSSSSASAAAKLLQDLVREFGVPEGESEADPAGPSTASRAVEPAPRPVSTPEVQLEALSTIRSVMDAAALAQIESPRLEIILDRLERMVDRVLSSGQPSPGRPSSGQSVGRPVAGQQA